MTQKKKTISLAQQSSRTLSITRVKIKSSLILVVDSLPPSILRWTAESLSLSLCLQHAEPSPLKA